MAKYLDTNGVSHLASKIDERITKRRGIYLVEHGQVTWDGNTFQTDAIMTSADILAYMNYATLAVQISKNDNSVVTLFEFETTNDATQVYFKSALDGNNEYLFAAMDVDGTYAQITGEIRTDIAEKLSDVETMKTSKANIDGSYGQMTVGNADQLLSTVGITDETPYLFRTSGGSADIGDRENDKIVGGTVAWNQQMREMSSTYYAADGSSTVSISDGVATVTPAAQYGGVMAKTNNLPTIIDGHKLLAVASVLSESMHLFITLNAMSASAMGFVPSQNWQTLYFLITADSTKNKTFRVRVNDTSNFATFYVKNCMVFDLTQMFGSAIADCIYALEQSNAGSGVAYFRKLFPKPFYEHNSGELLSVQTNLHRMVGFNQLKSFLGYSIASTITFNTDNAVRVISGMEYEFNHGSVTNATSWRHALVCYNTNGTKLTDSGLITYSGSGGLGYNQSGKYYVNPTDGTKTSDIFTPQFDGYVIPFITGGNASTSTVVADPCIHLVWDGERDGEYEAYQEWTYALDSDLELRGIPKLDANNNLYYDGDTYESDGTVTRRYGVVDLGTLSWTKPTATNYMNFASNGIKTVVKVPPSTNDGYKGIICSLYSSVPVSALNDKYIYITIDGQIRVKDTANEALTAAEFKTLMSGVYLVYELATPTTESADAYQNPQIVDDWGTEEYIDMRDVQIPVGHSTWYMNNLRAKLEMSPNSPNADGLYLVKHENGINTYVAYIKELPGNPNDNGTYVLKLTKNDSTATLAWVSE